jgi:flagellar hook-length control protein FliK
MLAPSAAVSPNPIAFNSLAAAGVAEPGGPKPDTADGDAAAAGSADAGSAATFPAALQMAGAALRLAVAEASPPALGGTDGDEAPEADEAAMRQGLPHSGKDLPSLPASALPALPSSGSPLSGSTPSLRHPPLSLLESPGAPFAAEGNSSLGGRIDAAGSAALRDWMRLDAPAPAATTPPEGEPRTQGSQAGALDLAFLSSAHSSSLDRVRGGPAVDVATTLAAQSAAADGRRSFEDAVGQRLAFMVGQGTYDARVRVHPEHLGPIDIHVKLSGDAAHVSFTSPHSLVRDALADAVPRLRELLGDAGLSLAHADVDSGGSDSSGRPDARSALERFTVSEAEQVVEAALADDGRTQSLVRRGLVDTFA